MIIPSIDLMNGRAVQLRQGRDLLLTDERDPVALAAELGRYGPVAIVDLDAALGRGDNLALVHACCRVAECRVGGGIRTEEGVRDLIRRGASKVVIGTRAQPEFLEKLPASWIVVALDTDGDEVLTHGWTERSGRKLIDEATRLAPYCNEFLFTQVRREGMLQGADIETARRLRDVVDRPITVAGGIRSAEEIVELERLGFHSQIGRAYYEGRIDLAEAWIGCVEFDERGLVPTIAQDAESGSVLMLAYSSAESLDRTLREGEGWYWSRSRQALWRKGETSGNTQRLARAAYDCDGDAVLFSVRQEGPACHLGTGTCFGVEIEPILRRLEATISNRATESGSGSYSRKLLEHPGMVAAKLREETLEVIEAEGPDHIAWECADLIYHLLVKMRAAGVPLARVEAELRSRFR